MSVDIDFISLISKSRKSADNIWITRSLQTTTIGGLWMCGEPIWSPEPNMVWSTRETNGLENVVSDHLNKIIFAVPLMRN